MVEPGLVTFVPGVTIQCKAHDLRDAAIAAHKAWMKAPSDLTAKARYASALHFWAVETGNAKADQHAAELEREIK